MSALYAESSAVLRWLLGHPDGPTIQRTLAAASSVVTSALTGLEVARTIRRLAALRQISSGDRDRTLSIYAAAAGHWKIFSITNEVLTRAGEPFPVEPIRSLDAIHLATALLYAREAPLFGVLTSDERVRDNADALGMGTVPG
jgi:predicted nucleic acid-binding protein